MQQYQTITFSISGSSYNTLQSKQKIVERIIEKYNGNILMTNYSHGTIGGSMIYSVQVLEKYVSDFSTSVRGI